MRVAILGPGLQCRRRAPVVQQDPDSDLVAIAGTSVEHARTMTDAYGGEPSGSWQDVVEREDVDAVLVCTPPNLHAEMTIAALEAGNHVLCEKPLCRTMDEARRMLDAAEKSGRILKCGFNHRHHPAIFKAREAFARGDFGEPMFARCRYGIVGRPDYADEWRADPEQAAGGQFIEQGTHALDLFRWFLGELTEVACMSSIHYFKDQTMDDGGMALFRTASGATATLHTTLTQWKNLFSFEVFGTDGYACIEGLGGGYGVEKLITGKRDFSAPFQDTVTHFRGGDKSWKAEWAEFSGAVRENRAPLGDGRDGLAAMNIALTAYEAERNQRVLPIGE